MVRRHKRKKAEFDFGRAEAKARHEAALEVMVRQAAINRALGLGRVPLLGAKIIRALGDAGLLGRGVRVIGTHALYAYEAAAGVFIDPSSTTTEDIDLLFDSRAVLRFVATEEVTERGLIGLLKRVDRSFERTSHGFRAANDEGYLVDLVKPLRDPPWGEDRAALAADKNDLIAVEIEGLGRVGKRAFLRGNGDRRAWRASQDGNRGSSRFRRAQALGFTSI